MGKEERERAEREFSRVTKRPPGQPADRAEEEANATREKTARLKQQRLERDAPRKDEG